MIQIKNLNKSFQLYNQNDTNINVFKNINFRVNKGEVVALTGNSGTGKSTLLKLIYGSYVISKGDVLISDINIRKSSPRDILKLRKNKLGYVSQFLRVVPRVPTIDVVIEPLLEIGCEKKIALKKAQEILERLNIPKNLWNLSPLTFSGGEQQRVNIARGFIHNYPYLLLDEPTASLDQNNKNVVLDLIEKAKLNGSAIIGIFHDETARNKVATREVNLENLWIMKKTNGNLFVIVGASGVGKDTLLNEIKARLENFYFVKRYITRTLDKNNEDHIAISNTDFQNKVKDGFFAISWQAHSLSYGIPKDIEDELKKGVNVIFNGSRLALKQIRESYPDAKIICIIASKKTIESRLISRNRESKDDIKKRLNREVGKLPSDTIYVKNDIDLETGVNNLINALNY